MDLLRLQQRLERLYEVSVPWPVTDFLTSDTSLIDALDADGFTSREKLLIQQNYAEDELSLSLFIDTRVLDRLRTDDPMVNLHSGNLDDFLITLEGVSHFVCVAWHAKHDRSLTLMELELQGEVDKFVTLVQTLSEQDKHCPPARLRSWQFEQFSLAPEMDRQHQNRYRDANNFARRYCQHLDTTYLQRRTSQAARLDMHAELRRFYRLDQRNKIQAIRDRYRTTSRTRLCP